MKLTVTAPSLFPINWMNGGCKSFEEFPFAIDWKDATVASTLQADSDDKDCYEDSINADSYFGRLKILNYIMEETPIHSTVPQQLNMKNSMHFLWAFVSVFHWMKYSGRLSNASQINSSEEFFTSNCKRGDISINHDSWWGRVNFAFFISILIAAKLSSVIQKPMPIVTSSYMDTLDDLKPAVDGWKVVFDKYKQTNGKFENDTMLDEFQGEVWKAHTISLQTGMQINQDYLKKLPKLERIFSVGLCRILENIACIRTRTDLEYQVDNGFAYYPFGILIDKSIEAHTRQLKTFIKQSKNLNLSVALTDIHGMHLNRYQRVLEVIEKTAKISISNNIRFKYFIERCVAHNIKVRQSFNTVFRTLIFRDSLMWLFRVPVLLYWFIRSFIAKPTV